MVRKQLLVFVFETRHLIPAQNNLHAFALNITVKKVLAMELTIKPGLKGHIEKTVEKQDLASSYGSGHVDVFATPAMIALMEQAADLSIAKHLPDGQISVGFEVNIRHFKATLPGKKVYAESELLETDGRKFLFTVSAYDEDGCIGKGTHIRFAVEKSKFA